METELHEIEKAVLIVNDIKSLIIRNYQQSEDVLATLGNDEYIKGYRDGFTDCLKLVRNIINRY